MHWNRKTLILFVCAFLALSLTVGGVLAFLTDRTDTVKNKFAPATVTCAVEEDFENGVKENVAVRNTGNTPAFVRAAVIATFVGDDGKVLADAPVEGTDYTVTWADADWIRGADGYWYCQRPLLPDEASAPLIRTASSTAAPDGYRLNLQIIASAVASAPEKAVLEAWGATVSEGLLVPAA